MPESYAIGKKAKQKKTVDGAATCRGRSCRPAKMKKKLWANICAQLRKAKTKRLQCGGHHNFHSASTGKENIKGKMSGTSSISNGQVIAGKCWEMKGKRDSDFPWTHSRPTAKRAYNGNFQVAFKMISMEIVSILHLHSKGYNCNEIAARHSKRN